MRFRDALASGRPLLLDAAMGTELARRGADVAAPLWSARALLAAPGLVRAVHEDDVAAGADVVTTCTFRTHARNVRAAGAAVDPRALTALAARLAREAGARFVAGSLAPLEDCYSPELVPDDAALAREHAAQADALAAAGCDLILIETMNSAREALAAARASGATGLPYVACAVTDGEGRLLSGEPLADLAKALLELATPPAALGVNCVPARRIARELETLAAAAPGVPLAAYGNTGRPTGGEAVYTEPITPEEYAALAPRWIALGARLVGGCCGTTAAHTRALRAALDTA